MPETKRAGTLISPDGNCEVLSEGEHRFLVNCLEISRSGPETHSGALSSIAICLRESPEFICGRVLDYYVESRGHTLPAGRGDFDTAESVLVKREADDPFPILSTEEHVVITNAINAYRLGGWFANWLKGHLNTIANPTSPADRHPSPLVIAGSLTEAIAEFGAEEKSARELMLRRPDLFSPPPSVAQEPKPKAPAASHRSRKRSAAG
jgi:hypothetical protein